MPYVSEKQRRFFEAVRHGWRPDRVDAPPMHVVEKFHREDQAARRRRLADALRRAGSK